MGREPDKSLVGRTFAKKFAIEAVIGGGAMGAVYRARQIALDKAVAIKVMHRELSSDPSYVARFLREAKAASRIDHPNSVRVIDFGEENDGLLYLAMELLDGRDLYTLLREDGPLDAPRIGDIVLQVLAAVSAAHETGVVHRDIKPENIMILRGTDDEGRARDVVKVCDFGVAKITDHRKGDVEPVSGPAITTEGLVVGTPEYMSPEQGRGEPLDARSDIYSVGVILYQMLAGRVPFDADSALGIVLKHVTEYPVPPGAVRPGVHPKLEAVCLRALEKKREARYQTAREMRAELRVALGHDAAFQASAAPPSVGPLEALVLREQPPSPKPDPTPVVPTGAPAAIASGTRPGMPPMRHEAVAPAAAAAAPAGAAATADTAVAFDSSAIRAVSPSVHHEPSPALSPAVLPRPRMSGIIIGGALLATALGIVGYTLRDSLSSSSPDSSPVAATTTRSSETSRSSKVIATDEKAAETPAATPPPSAGPSAAPESRPVAKTPRLPPPTGSASASASAPAPAPAGSATAAVLPATSASVPAATPSARIDAKAAKIQITGVRALGVPPEVLRSAVPEAKIAQCYRASLATLTAKPPPSSMVLHVEANEEGKIQTTSLTGAPPIPERAGQCVMRSMVGKQIAAEGSFLVSGDVDIVFSAE